KGPLEGQRARPAHAEAGGGAEREIPGEQAELGAEQAVEAAHLAVRIGLEMASGGQRIAEAAPVEARDQPVVGIFGAARPELGAHPGVESELVQPALE